MAFVAGGVAIIREFRTHDAWKTRDRQPTKGDCWMKDEGRVAEN